MIDMRRLSDDLTEAFIGYQYRLDHPFPSSTLTEEAVTAKYMNDSVFRGKVQSLVVGVMDIVSRNVAAKEEAAQPQVPEEDRKYPPFLQRLLVEQRELQERQNKLEAFIHTEAFDELERTDQGLLIKQSNQQHSLLQTLNQRINGAIAKRISAAKGEGK